LIAFVIDIILFPAVLLLENTLNFLGKLKTTISYTSNVLSKNTSKLLGKLKTTISYTATFLPKNTLRFLKKLETKLLVCLDKLIQFILHLIWIITVSVCVGIIVCLLLQAIMLVTLAFMMIGIDLTPILKVVIPNHFGGVIDNIVDYVADNVGPFQLYSAEELEAQEFAAQKLAAQELAAQELEAQERAIKEFEAKELAAQELAAQELAAQELAAKSPPKVSLLAVAALLLIASLR
jgi:hypothetical protein